MQPHKVLTWLRATLCGVPVWASSLKFWLLLHWGYIGTLSWLRYVRLCYEWLCYVMTAATAAALTRREAVLWLPCQPGENKGVCSSYAPRISFHLLAHTLPTMGSANSVHSEIHWDNWLCEQDQQDSTCATTIEPMIQSLETAATEPIFYSYWSPHALESVLHNNGSHSNEKPKHCNEE